MTSGCLEAATAGDAPGPGVASEPPPPAPRRPRVEPTAAPGTHGRACGSSAVATVTAGHLRLTPALHVLLAF